MAMSKVVQDFKVVSKAYEQSQILKAELAITQAKLDQIQKYNANTKHLIDQVNNAHKEILTNFFTKVTLEIYNNVLLKGLDQEDINILKVGLKLNEILENSEVRNLISDIIAKAFQMSIMQSHKFEYHS